MNKHHNKMNRQHEIVFPHYLDEKFWIGHVCQCLVSPTRSLFRSAPLLTRRSSAEARDSLALRLHTFICFCDLAKSSRACVSMFVIDSMLSIFVSHGRVIGNWACYYYYYHWLFWNSSGLTTQLLVTHDSMTHENDSRIMNHEEPETWTMYFMIHDSWLMVHGPWFMFFTNHDGCHTD